MVRASGLGQPACPTSLPACCSLTLCLACLGGFWRSSRPGRPSCQPTSLGDFSRAASNFVHAAQAHLPNSLASTVIPNPGQLTSIARPAIGLFALSSPCLTRGREAPSNSYPMSASSGVNVRQRPGPTSPSSRTQCVAQGPRGSHFPRKAMLMGLSAGTPVLRPCLRRLLRLQSPEIDQRLSERSRREAGIRAQAALNRAGQGRVHKKEEPGTSGFHQRRA